MRVLVTGSRSFTDRDRVFAVLNEFAPSVVVHGACPEGADEWAAQWCRHWTVAIGHNPEERHPADWTQGRNAGFARNASMVALGADVCLAFIGPCISPRCGREAAHDSHGATDTARRARVAGIPVREERLSASAGSAPSGGEGGG